MRSATREKVQPKALLCVLRIVGAMLVQAAVPPRGMLREECPKATASYSQITLSEFNPHLELGESKRCDEVLRSKLIHSVTILNLVQITTTLQNSTACPQHVHTCTTEHKRSASTGNASIQGLLRDN